jgi:alpha-beta hydrolase superfamily lysophospholipase
MKFILRLLAVILILYFVSLIILYFIQEKILFQSVVLPQNHSYKFNQTFKEINLKTKDNNIINALHFKVQNPKGVILYFHGNAGNLDRWGNITSYFTKFNHDVFVIDYRSYGKSTGKFNEQQMYNDAQISYNYLKQQYSETQISVYGRSLGCTFAVNVAKNNHPKQLILESPFYNIKDVAKHHYPFVPFSLLLKYHFNSNKYIEHVSCKTTIFHGTNDKVVPFSSGKKLFEKSNQQHTSFIPIENGTHHNLFNFEVYQAEISELFN